MASDSRNPVLKVLLMTLKNVISTEALQCVMQHRKYHRAITGSRQFVETHFRFISQL